MLLLIVLYSFKRILSMDSGKDLYGYGCTGIRKGRYRASHDANSAQSLAAARLEGPSEQKLSVY